MDTLRTKQDILSLFTALDSEGALDGKIKIIKKWTEGLPGVTKTKYLSIPLSDISEKKEKSFISPVVITEENYISKTLHLDTNWIEGCLYYPVVSSDGHPRGALLFKCDDPIQLLQIKSVELGLIVSKLKDAIELSLLTNKKIIIPSAEESEHEMPLFSPAYIGVLQYLDMPLYVSNISDRFVFVNKAFLNKFGYHDVQEVNDCSSFFVNPGNRAEELSELARHGNYHGFNLTIRHKNGLILQVRDYATFSGGYILGVLVDVTELVNLNNEFRDALLVQETLNDDLIQTGLALQKTQITSIKALARLAEHRDMETGEHLDRISGYTRLLAEETLNSRVFPFDISKQYIDDLSISSMLHDIGKVGISDMILRKSGRLTNDEWVMMRKHTTLGWSILSQADLELGEQSFLTLASHVALNHHERYDGTGYPRGIQGDDIPLSARIVAIADVYDALTSDRPYKESWSHDRACEEIISQKGKQFDPLLIDIFERLEGEFMNVQQNSY